MRTPEGIALDCLDVFIVGKQEMANTRSISKLFDKEEELRQRAIQASYANDRESAERWREEANTVAQQIEDAKLNLATRN